MERNAIAKFVAGLIALATWVFFEAIAVLVPAIAEYHGLTAHAGINNVAQMMVGITLLLLGFFHSSRPALPYFFYALVIIHALNF